MTWVQTAAAREALASALPNVSLIECVRITHLALEVPFLWANFDRAFEAVDFQSQLVRFEPFGFNLKIGRVSTTGALENTGSLSFAPDDRLYDFARDVHNVGGDADPFTIENFWYLESDPSEPAFQPPWIWRSRRIKTDKDTMTIDLASKTFMRKDAGIRYNYVEWPTLLGWDFLS